MSEVSIHAPRTPVTEGSNGVAAATVPNVCKMPGTPFTPTPLPNVGRSGDTPKGYSTTVFVSGARVAIEGCSFGSQGDAPSKGSGGGLISANTCGPTRFIGPGTPDVRIEGKGVHLLGDPTFNNCGQGGGPPNAATMAGIVQDALMARADRLGVAKALQQICDMLCQCEAEGTRNENCLYRKMDAKERGERGAGTTRTQVPYDMEPEDGGPPKPYMSKDQPWRATRNWSKAGSRRPDAVVVRSPGLDPRGKDIRAVIEVKTKGTDWGPGQREAYEEIAAGRERLFVLDDESCQCPPPEQQKQPEPVVAEKPVGKKTPVPAVALNPVAGVVGAAALAAAAVALVAAAPLTGVAAAAVALVAVSSGSSQPSGGSDAL